jgi:hypothetical protein
VRTVREAKGAATAFDIPKLATWLRATPVSAGGHVRRGSGGRY